MALIEPIVGAWVSAVLDESAADYEQQVETFLDAVARAEAKQAEADRPVYVIRRAGPVVHVHVFPAASVPGGAKGSDQFGRKLKPTVDLAGARAEGPEVKTSEGLKAELQKLLKGGGGA